MAVGDKQFLGTTFEKQNANQKGTDSSSKPSTWLSVTGSGFLTGVTCSSDVSITIDGVTQRHIGASGSTRSWPMLLRFNSSLIITIDNGYYPSVFYSLD